MIVGEIQVLRSKSRVTGPFGTFGAAAAALMAGALVLCPGAAMAQKKTFTLKDLGLTAPTESSAATMIVDDQKCRITSDMAQIWIGQSEHMRSLRDAFQNTIANWNSIDINLFGHAATPNKGDHRDAALAAVREHAGKLVELAQVYAARQTKSCDVCYSLRDWGVLWEVSARVGPVGELRRSQVAAITTAGKATITPLNVPFIIRDLSQAQVQHPDVQSLLEFFVYLIIRHDQSPADPFGNLSPDVVKQNEAVCFESNAKAAQCTQGMLKRFMRSVGDKIYDTLARVSKPNDNSPRMLSMHSSKGPDCQPRNGPPYEDFTPISWIKTPQVN